MNRFAILPPLLAVAACHHAPSVTADNATGNEVAAKVAAAGGGAKLTPGHYDMTFAITKVAMPGLPPSAQGMMDQMKKTQTSAICVTPEQANKPAASMFTGQANANCTYDHFTMAGGAIDASTTCKMGPVTSVSTMKGTIAADGFHMDVTSNSKGVPGQPMASATVTATMDAKRAGACTGKEG